MHHNIQNKEETQTRKKQSKSKTYGAFQIWPLSRRAHKCACSWVGIGRTDLKQTKHGQHKENNTSARCIQCPPWCSWHAQWCWPGGRWRHRTWRSQAGSAGSTCPHQPGTKQMETCNFQDLTWQLVPDENYDIWYSDGNMTLAFDDFTMLVVRAEHTAAQRNWEKLRRLWSRIQVKSWEGCGVEFKGKVAKAVE